MEETQNSKKRLLPMILGTGILLLIIIIFIFMCNKKDYEITRFIIDVKNISNHASSYFAKNIDPIINKSDRLEADVEVSDLTSDAITNALEDYEGIVKIVILNDKTYYYLNIKNNKYKYSGNLNDLIIENIKEIKK